MATILLSAAGAAVGGAFGGSVLGLSSVLIGRAIGATVGQAIDRKLFGQKLLGAGGEVVEQGKVDRFRLTGASEGASLPDTFGRMRVSGQVIWASRFLESASTERVSTGGGKGGGGSASETKVKSYSYSVSIAVALGTGQISRLGRIWADGNEIAPRDLNLRFYTGSAEQLPDPKIEAVEGSNGAPAFRGTSYVVIEDLELSDFGNRVPQFSFEVIRLQQSGGEDDTDLARTIRAVALVPGTGEYSLAKTNVHVSNGPGKNVSVNVNTPLGIPDFRASIRALRSELPNYNATSLVVSWFGTDLRCGSCKVAPRVEQTKSDGVEMPWRVSGLTRDTARVVPYENNRPVYGGTPTDASVVEAIEHLKAGGRRVMFYPFLLMAQMAENGRPDPWTGAGDQPPLPWRGRITLQVAPGRPGSSDGTTAAEDQIAEFFGTAAPGDFEVTGTKVSYVGTEEESYRRFILHYAHLCAAAGGVESFCIGSEMRGLTQIRGAGGTFPAVEAFRALAADVRQILGPSVKLGYAADWSEYFGYHPQDGSGDVFFHLDPLWADDEIDFIGIDNYMPLSDWRDGEDHADVDWGAVHRLDYLRANIEGGEGFDWYYASDADSKAQERTPIADGVAGEDWVFRYKDLRNWWTQPHHDRPGGIRNAAPTPWVPQSKPIWFTEIGCAAVDKGANAPNRFFDPKSSESGLPPYSNGRRDDTMQMQFLIAQLGYWADPAKNPVSTVYGGPMIDMDNAFVWAWDARPFPFFPNYRSLWSDGGNYGKGHWLNGRTSSRALASVVREICHASGIYDIDVSGLYGVVRGFVNDGGGTGRSALQPLMLAYGFDAIEKGGTLVFRSRNARPSDEIGIDDLVETDEVPGSIERIRSPEAETVGRVRISAIEAQGSYQVKTGEAVFPDETVETLTESDLPLLLTRSEINTIAERWLAEARVARDSLRFSLPPSRTSISVGDVVTVEEDGAPARFRIDRLEQAGMQIASAVRVDADLYTPSSDLDDSAPPPAAFVAPVPVYPVFLDLPLLTGGEVPHAPHIAVAADPWPGSAAVFKSSTDSGFVFDTEVSNPAIIGVTETPMAHARSGIWDRGPALRVRLSGGVFDSVTETDVLNGANVVAIGDGQSDVWEIFQFRTATLVGESVYDLSMRLRGQAGTDAVMPAVWPEGSIVVPITSALVQLGLTSAERGLSRTYRIGPSGLPVDDPVYVETTRAFLGVGLRPLSPVHLRARSDGLGGTTVRWTRRTRVDGDGWLGLDVPLGEERESYLVRVLQGNLLIREATVQEAGWTYGAVEQAEDAVSTPFTVEVAQLSDRFGPGPFGRIAIDD